MNEETGLDINILDVEFWIMGPGAKAGSAGGA